MVLGKNAGWFPISRVLDMVSEIGPNGIFWFLLAAGLVFESLAELIRRWIRSPERPQMWEAWQISAAGATAFGIALLTLAGLAFFGFGR
jgi:hypothetical protein